jgi:NADP-dependent 3-hydroxy acid dehydrogenase YdfG
MSGLVVITGAAAGIGLATAKKFYEHGHSLLLIDKSETFKWDVLPSKRVMCRTVDVTKLDLLIAAVKEAESVFGPAECLVNNAAIACIGNVVTQNPEEWKVQLEVNTLGAFHGVKSVIDGMVQRKRGTIINIGSEGDKNILPLHAAYCASKYAVRAFTELLYEELSEAGVRTILISPGITDTDIGEFTSKAEENVKYDVMFGKKPKMKPAEAADIIFWTYQLPQHICIRNVLFSAVR